MRHGNAIYAIPTVNTSVSLTPANQNTEPSPVYANLAIKSQRIRTQQTPLQSRTQEIALPQRGHGQDHLLPTHDTTVIQSEAFSTQLSPLQKAYTKHVSFLGPRNNLELLGLKAKEANARL